MSKPIVLEDARKLVIDAKARFDREGTLESRKAHDDAVDDLLAATAQRSIVTTDKVKKTSADLHDEGESLWVAAGFLESADPANKSFRQSARFLRGASEAYDRASKQLDHLAGDPPF